MKKSTLSKSTFIRGLQCSKSLYLYKNQYKDRDRLSAAQKEKFKRGWDVGKLAQQLFPNGRDVSPTRPQLYAKSVTKTTELINANFSVIYEASFIYSQVYVALDILKNTHGKWRAYEVKSSLKISDTYLYDAALQYWVITNAGISLEDFFIVHINPDYKFRKQLELDQLFNCVSVLDKILPMQKDIAINVERLKETLTDVNTLKQDISLHCTHPYPCDFMGYCRKELAKTTVFDINGINEKDQYELYYKNQHLPDDIPPACITPFVAQQLAVYSQKKPYVNKEKLDLLKNENVLLFDVISLAPAIPFIEKTQPFEALPVVITIGTKAQEDFVYRSYFIEIEALNKKAYPNELEEIMSDKVWLTNNDDSLKSTNTFFNAFPQPKTYFSLEGILKSGDFIHPKIKNDFKEETITKVLHPGLFFSKDNIKNIEKCRSVIMDYYQSSDLFKEELQQDILKYAQRRCKTLEHFLVHL